MYTFEECRFDKFEYLIAYPECLKSGEKAPAVLFLHGAGTVGHDLDMVKRNAIFLHSAEKDLPFNVFAPQCQWSSWFDVFSEVISFAEYVASRPDVDADRLYLVGVSMGGYGAWQLATSRPQLFAALMPLCGGGMPWLAERLAALPIWAFHGVLDETVSVTNSIDMVKAVNRHGGNARLTVYPDAAHNCWDPTFTDDAVWAWLLSNRKKS